LSLAAIARVALPTGERDVFVYVVVRPYSVRNEKASQGARVIDAQSRNEAARRDEPLGRHRLRGLVALLLGFLAAAAGLVLIVAVAWALDYADAGDDVSIAVVTGTAAILGITPWLSVRLLLPRGMIFAAEVLTIVVLIWVLLLFVTLWVALIGGLSGYRPFAPLAFWLMVSAAIVFSAVTWWITRSMLRRPLVSAAGALTVCLFVLVIALVVFPQVGSVNFGSSPVGVGRPQGSSQHDVQASYLDDRAALHDGIVETKKSIEVTFGDSYELEATVCGSDSEVCDEAGLPAPASSGSRAPIKTGARISAWATASEEIGLSPKEAIIQPVLNDADYATWYWYVSPRRVGDLGVTLHFRVLRGETDQALVADKLMHVRVKAVAPIEVVKPRGAADMAKAVGDWLNASIGWAVGVLGALSITGPMLAKAMKRARSRLRRHRSKKKSSTVGEAAARSRSRRGRSG
jgi:hypothetical protein